MSYQVFLVDVPDKPHIKVIDLRGEVDETNLDDFKKEFMPLLETEGVTTFIIHIKNLEFCNSGFIGCMAGVYSDLREQGKKMMFGGGNEHILDIFGLVGLTNLVEHHEKLEDAIKSVDT